MSKQNIATAAKFIRRLIAVCCVNYKPDEDSQSEYVKALSSYNLTTEQWDQAFRLLISRQQTPGLPPLGTIYGVIREVQAADRREEASRNGKMIICVDGHEYAVMIRLETCRESGDYWAVQDCGGRYGGMGMEVHAWLSLRPKVQLVGIYPDDRSLIAQGEMPTPEEMAEIRAEFAQWSKSNTVAKPDSAGARERFYEKSRRGREIDTMPINEKPAKSVRKENPTPASEPEADDAYWASLLAG